MTHRIGIDHRRKSYRSPRREEQTGQGRIERAYTPVSEATRRTRARDVRDVVDGEVRFDNGDRALYATDASNYRQVPLGVVLPRSVEGVVAAVELAPGSVSLKDFEEPEHVAYIVGNEVDGVSKEALELADVIVELPMLGKKESLNVSVTAGIVLYHGIT